MEETFRYLNKSEILQINRLMIERFGGEYIFENGNVLYPGSLDHLISIIRGDISYYKDISIYEKASLLCTRIIQGHIFFDGNKRTGFESAVLLLKLNEIHLKFDLASAFEITLDIANKRKNWEDFTNWLIQHSEEQ